MLLRRLLEHSGFVVDEADLILLDVIMNDIDGFVACRKIKQMPSLKHVPIIFVTGISGTSSIVEGLDAGGCDYVAKPINRHEALARMRNHLKIRVWMSVQTQSLVSLVR